MGSKEEGGCERVVPCLVGEVWGKGEGVIKGKEGYSCTCTFCGGVVAAIGCEDGARLVSRVDCFWVEGVVSVCWVALGDRCKVDMLGCEELDCSCIRIHVPLEVCVRFVWGRGRDGLVDGDGIPCIRAVEFWTTVDVSGG